jgi:hypothetical protein
MLEKQHETHTTYLHGCVFPIAICIGISPRGLEERPGEKNKKHNNKTTQKFPSGYFLNQLEESKHKKQKKTYY